MLKKLILIPVLALSFMAVANVAVIVHPSNAAALSQDDINKIFTGRAKTFTDGKAAEPVNLTETVAARADLIKSAGAFFEPDESLLV